MFSISCIPHVFVVSSASPRVFVVFSAAHLMYSSCFRFLECVSSLVFRMHKKFLVRLISCIPHVFRMHKKLAYAGAARKRKKLVAAHLMYSSCFRFLECVSSLVFRMHKKFLVRLISCIPHVFRMHKNVAYA